MRRRLLLVPVLVALAALGAACSSTTGSSSTAGGTTGAGGTGGSPPAGPSTSWATFLDRVPTWHGLDRASVTAQDLKTVRAQGNLSIDSPVKGDDSTKVLTDLGVGPVPSWWSQDIRRWHDLAGFSPFEPDRVVEVTAPPTDSYAVLEGTFDTARVTAALKDSGGMGDGVTTETYAGETYLKGAGEEGKVDAKRAQDGLERLGRPQRILVASDHVLVTLTDEAMHRAIDAWAGRGTAMDDDDTALAVHAADDVHALTIASGTGSDESGSGSGSTGTTRRTGTTRKATGTTVASGPKATVVLVGATAAAGDTPSGSYVVAVKTSDADATAAADGVRSLLTTGRSDRTQSPWSKTFTSPDVRADGRVVIATMATEHPAAARAALFTQDNLVDV